MVFSTIIPFEFNLAKRKREDSKLTLLQPPMFIQKTALFFKRGILFFEKKERMKERKK